MLDDVGVFTQHVLVAGIRQLRPAECRDLARTVETRTDREDAEIEIVDRITDEGAGVDCMPGDGARPAGQVDLVIELDQIARRLFGRRDDVVVGDE